MPRLILQAGESKGAGPEIWVESKGTPARVSVEAGISDGTYTELLSNEIPEGALVITGKTSTNGQPQTRTGTASENPFNNAQPGPPGFTGGPR